MFHARFVVDNDIAVALADAIDDGAQIVIDGAVAAGALAAAHCDQIEACPFRDGRANLVVQVVAFVHATRQTAHRRAAGCQRLLDLFQHVFPDVANGPVQVEAKYHVEIAARIGVNRQNRARLGLGEIFDHHCGDSGFAHTAFPGQGNRCRHGGNPP